MADPIAIRAALATRVAMVEGLRVVPFVLGSIDPPVAMIVPGDMDYSDLDNGGMDKGSYRVLLLVSNADDPLGQAKLDNYLKTSGPTSVKAAIEGDRKLDGTVDRCRVDSRRNAGHIGFAGIVYLGAELIVGIVTPPEE